MDPTVEETTVSFLLFEDIENMSEIKELLINGQLKAAVVNPALIYHMDQLLISAHKCLYNAKNQQLKTKTLFTELLYNLFPSRSIRDALKVFGAQDKDQSAIFAIFSSEKDKIPNGLKEQVKGTLVPMDKITERRDVAAIKKLYKIPSEVVEEKNILDCILTKMATKELLL